MRAASVYGQVQASTADQPRLLVLLLEAAERHLRHARAALDDDADPAGVDVPLRKAEDIVWELHRTLHPAAAPELASALAGSYEFVCFRIVEAMRSRSPAAVDDAIRVLTPIVNAYQQAVAGVAAAAPDSEVAG